MIGTNGDEDKGNEDGGKLQGGGDVDQVHRLGVKGQQDCQGLSSSPNISIWRRIKTLLVRRNLCPHRSAQEDKSAVNPRS